MQIVIEGKERRTKGIEVVIGRGRDNFQFEVKL